MKPRILKKLSKKALAIYAASPRRDLQREAERSWIDNEFEQEWLCRERRLESAKKERAHRQGRVRVNHVPSIGGEADYFGEGTEFRTFYEWAFEYVWSTSINWDDYDFERCDYPKSSIKGRLTGKKVLELLRVNASEVPS
ncbi:hypothetical protein [Vreelandella titanicae]|uniref:hypothetical protein n=1 Tax=Vreelandella titanicae TaxID=664683 RepID=UPI004045118C